MAGFDLKNYADVSTRIEEFITEFPEGQIVTTLVKDHDGEVIFEARVYRNNDERQREIYTNGFAREVEGTGNVNKTSHVENCETSAIGRALANMAYGTNANRASRSEMLKVARMDAEHADMMEQIADLYDGLSDEATGVIGGETVNLKAYVKEKGAEIKSRFTVAKAVLTALTTVTPATG